MPWGATMTKETVKEAHSKLPIPITSGLLVSSNKARSGQCEEKVAYPEDTSSYENHT